MSEFWNKKFGSEEYLYGIEPNQFLKERCELIKPNSKILCLGEGEGRNATFLAQNCRVVAIDSSIEGQRKALNLAKNRNVEIDYRLMDISEWKGSEDHFDAIISTYFHLEYPLREIVFEKIAFSLKHSGVFIGEFFSLNQLNYKSGGPKDETLLYDIEFFYNISQNHPLSIVRLAEEEVNLSEGIGHKGLASVIRVIFKKVG